MEFLIKISDKIKSFSDYVIVHQKKDNGVLVGEYRMRLKDIVLALSNANSEGGLTHETPFLPKNCIKITTKTNSHEVYIEIPKRKWQITYNNQSFVVGFPRLIFKYFVSNQRIINLKVVAIKGNESINQDTELYRFPYSNVHHFSGDVCMGSNQFPEINNLADLEKMHYLFFGTPFGDDYGASTIKGMPLKDLFEEFTEREFDDDLLVPLQTTFGQFFN